MDFALSDDQRAIQEAARDFLTDAANPDVIRAAVEGATGFDEGLWQALAGEMGFAGLMVPEEFGGLGLGAVEMALVLEETGRVLAPVPFFETAVLAVQAVLAAGSEEQKASLLPRLASGTRASFAGTASRPTLRDGRLTGVADFATFAHVADLIIVATADDSLVVLDADTPGLTIEALPALDRLRRFAKLSFDCAVGPDMVLGAPGSAKAAIERTLTIGAGLLAAEQTGGMQYSLDATVDYAKQRVQFGRLIGSFQAYKHMLADMMLLVEASRSAAYYAAAAIDENGDELAEACHIARAYVSDAYRSVTGDAIQLHGGIGFTWEHHAHLYFKRARASASWLGTPDQHREALAQIIMKDAA
ncbi:acyl-CoA dehydrogenase family protein [Sphingobium vermicomposti]|uniref:Alkylation response protein AidB-like acyl-CoA dehydrogenase n=1 Tax=Sphingobium vermicomposti TaxID=529005 RepID=A0A846MDE6_9SPHN|nr:acyl-CoA dehydrogenase family protein [Sphingobium vermicomposti]NIJ18184.1 alkylation response protein AidB-like acyl-CoA dehydrogenase [Sphingobium vermicomposti]